LGGVGALMLALLLYDRIASRDIATAAPSAPRPEPPQPFVKSAMADPDLTIERRPLAAWLKQLEGRPQHPLTPLQPAAPKSVGSAVVKPSVTLSESAPQSSPTLQPVDPIATTVTQLARQPITTQPNTTDYDWAGSSLQKLLGTASLVAETWPFFSGPSKPAVIAGTNAGDNAITMAQLTTLAPEVLGPAGADPEEQGQKYFFVKFLDPSDFPPFAYVGFNPDAVTALRRRLEDQRRMLFSSESQFLEIMRGYVADLMWQDRKAIEEFAALVRPAISTETVFRALKAAYKTWAIAGAKVDWAQTIPMPLEPFLGKEHLGAATALLVRQQTIRQELIQLLHRIDFEENQAILIESPTLHAIAGLSLQLHPRADGNYHPKDELWIYKQVADAKGQPAGWVLVEPQRTFDKTESGADFFTPFAWRDGALGFRKTITKAYLSDFAAVMDINPYPRAHFIRTAQPIRTAEVKTTGSAEWFRLVEDPTWPYFLAWELRFSGPGEASGALAHHSFAELHCTRGRVEITLAGNSAAPCTIEVTPARPVFLPASLPYNTITYKAAGPAHLQFFTRPKP
jgi:hypothetical protein